MATALLNQALANADSLDSGQREFLRATVLAHLERTQEARSAFLKYLDSPGYAEEIVRAAGLDPEQGELNACEIARLSEFQKHEQAAFWLLRLGFSEEASEQVRALEKLIGRPDWWVADERPWEAQALSAEILERSGNLQSAHTNYEQAVNALEASYGALQTDSLRIGIRGLHSAGDLCLNAARAALTASRKDAAFRYMQKGRARALLDLVNENLLADSANHETVVQRRRLEATLAASRGSLAHLFRIGERGEETLRIQETIATCERELRALVPAASLITRENVTLDQVAKQLSEDTLLIEYAVLGHELLMWAITTGGMAANHSEPVREWELFAKTLNFSEECASGGTLTDLRYFSDLLLKPFAKLIATHPRLLIVRHSCLHQVPFAVLPHGEASLCHTHAITYLPAAGVLMHTIQDRPPEKQYVLAVGNPAKMSAALGEGGRSPNPNLPSPAIEGSAEEASIVAAQFPASALLIREKATAKNVRENIGSASVLHFATHGLLHTVPYRSAILFANGESLSVAEFMGMKLDADLAVVSACDSGSGEITRGDEVIGLSRGLLAAGIRSVMVTQWPISDRVTVMIMERFYREYRAGAEPCVALSRAQSWLSRAGRNDLPTLFENQRTECSDKPCAHPQYWAPFFVLEAGRRTRPTPESEVQGGSPPDSTACRVQFLLNQHRAGDR